MKCNKAKILRFNKSTSIYLTICRLYCLFSFYLSLPTIGPTLKLDEAFSFSLQSCCTEKAPTIQRALHVPEKTLFVYKFILKHFYNHLHHLTVLFTEMSIHVSVYSIFFFLLEIYSSKEQPKGHVQMDCPVGNCDLNWIWIFFFKLIKNQCESLKKQRITFEMEENVPIFLMSIIVCDRSQSWDTIYHQLLLKKIWRNLYNIVLLLYRVGRR